MARIRTIKPEFFRNHSLYTLEMELNKKRNGPYLNLRVAFAGLFTVADREGRFRWSPQELKLDCLPYDPVDFNEILEALRKHGNPPAVVKYEVDGHVFGWIPNFLKHQRPKIDEAQSVIPTPIIAQSESNRTPVGLQSTQWKGSGRERKGTEITTANGSPSAVDFSEFRVPFGKRKGVYVLNLPVDECQVYLKSRGLSRQFKAALEWRIQLKDSERTGARSGTTHVADTLKRMGFQ